MIRMAASEESAPATHLMMPASLSSALDAWEDPAYLIEVLLVRAHGICWLCQTPVDSQTLVDSGFPERYDLARPQGEHIIDKSAGGPDTAPAAKSLPKVHAPQLTGVHLTKPERGA